MKYLNKIYYLILIFAIVILLFAIPAGYTYLNNQNISHIESDVKLSLTSTDVTKELNNSQNTLNYQVLVTNEDYLYSTLNVDDETFDRIDIPSDYEIIEGELEDYSYTILIPPISFVEYYKYFAFIVLLIIVSILIWNVFVVRNITKNLLKPLQTLKKNINILKNYDFSNLEIESQDKINSELLKFGEDLSDVLTDYNAEITKKELDTFEKLLIIEKQKDYLISTVHDIKGDIFNLKLRTKDEQMLKQMDSIINESEKAMNYFLNDEHNEFTDFENIRLDVLVFNTIKNKSAVIDDLDLDISMNVDKRNVHVNKLVITQLINNLVSNAIKHTPRFGEIRIHNKGNYLIFENETEDEVDVSKIFDLNYTTTDGAKIGYGMIRIKQIINSLGYSYDVKFEDNRFIFKLEVRYNDV